MPVCEFSGWQHRISPLKWRPAGLSALQARQSMHCTSHTKPYMDPVRWGETGDAFGRLVWKQIYPCLISSRRLRKLRASQACEAHNHVRPTVQPCTYPTHLVRYWSTQYIKGSLQRVQFSVCRPISKGSSWLWRFALLSECVGRYLLVRVSQPRTSDETGPDDERFTFQDPRSSAKVTRSCCRRLRKEETRELYMITGACMARLQVLSEQG
jgi:hypothetical protein